MAFANTVIGYPIEAPVDYDTLVVTGILLGTNDALKVELRAVVKLHAARVKLMARMRKTYGKLLKKELKMVVKRAPAGNLRRVRSKRIPEPDKKPMIKTINGILVVYPN